MALYVDVLMPGITRVRPRWHIARSDYPACLKSYEECEAFARQWHKKRPL